jgi:hypothetical protein
MILIFLRLWVFSFFLRFSFIFLTILFPNKKKECGIKVEERKNFVGSGCCHNSVKEVFDNLLGNSLLSEILLQLDTKDVEQWKESICSSVSLECMENAKSKSQIQEELKKTIFKKITSFF